MGRIGPLRLQQAAEIGLFWLAQPHKSGKLPQMKTHKELLDDWRRRIRHHRQQARNAKARGHEFLAESHECIAETYEVAISEVSRLIDQAANEPRPLPLAYEILTRLNRISMSDDAELRLIGGELTAQEIRTVRAFVRYILGGNS